MGTRVARLRDPLTLAVGALAVHRLTRLLVEDEITRPAREAVQRWARGTATRAARPQVEYLTGCPWCVGMYVAAAWAALAAASPATATALGAPLAWSSVTGVLASLE